MKKVFAICAVALFAVSFTSCKKDYTCTCTTVVTGIDDVVTTSTLNASKKDATTACDAAGAGAATTCVIS